LNVIVPDVAGSLPGTELKTIGCVVVESIVIETGNTTP